MKSFYDFYTKLQKLNEENEPVDPKVMDNTPSQDAMAQPNGGNGKDMSMNMQNSDETPKLTDKSKQGEEEESNLSPPEGKINYKIISKNLKHVTKYLPKFKNLDQEKGEQLEQLLSQISNLVNSFEGGMEEESPEGEEGEKGQEGEEGKSKPEGEDVSSMVGDKGGSPDMGGGIDMSGGSPPPAGNANTNMGGAMPQGMSPPS